MVLGSAVLLGFERLCIGLSNCTDLSIPCDEEHPEPTQVEEQAEVPPAEIINSVSLSDSPPRVVELHGATKSKSPSSSAVSDPIEQKKPVCDPEVPSGCFAWGCEVLEDKSLRVDQASAEPLVSVVPWFVDVHVRTVGTSSRMSACSPSECFPSTSG